MAAQPRLPRRNRRRRREHPDPGSSTIKDLDAYVAELNAPGRRPGVADFHYVHRSQMARVPGSRANHQAWPGGFDKIARLRDELPSRHDLVMTADELHAVAYAHGKVDDHSPDRRAMSPLAAFVHAADITSARVRHDRGAGTGLHSTLV